jgi:hypothetical protein
MQCFPVEACCLLLFVGIVVAVGLAVEKEVFSCRRRDELVSATVDGMLRDPATCQAAVRNLMELDVTTVVWRAGAIAAFVLACVAALLAGFCGSIWVVFFGVFFTALCTAYLRAGHERAHVSGPIYAGLRVASRLQVGERPEDVAPRQL